MNRYSYTVHVEAERWEGGKMPAGLSRLHVSKTLKPDTDIEFLTVSTRSGFKRAYPGQWIVKDLDGSLDVMTNEDFRAKFQEDK